ncbi:MAG: putative sulfate exporter family transporter [Candidatus Eisenbacteria bacterium]|nr:putative sulfate exporter family transporter [Candidatus Eisenbacteria bacterium]
MALALTVGCPDAAFARRTSKWLLQGAVVLLGFGLDLRQVLAAGAQGMLFAVVSIVAVFALGEWLRRRLGIRPLTSLLVSSGTAICGGSAIAAMASVTDAPQEDVSVAVGTVFLLNAAALVVFPPLGHALGLTPGQFGVWAGIAIHDVSSVVGAATAFGGDSLTTATAVKLSRVLYLTPVVLMVAAAGRRRAGGTGGAGNRAPLPWFIALFLLASLVRSLVPALAPHAGEVKLVAVSGFAAALYLIGSGISRATLAAVGARPLLQGVLLWLFMSAAALAAARATG